MVPRNNQTKYLVSFLTTYSDGTDERRSIIVWSTTICGAIRKATVIAAVDWHGHMLPVSVEIRAALSVKEAEYAEAR